MNQQLEPVLITKVPPRKFVVGYAVSNYYALQHCRRNPDQTRVVGSFKIQRPLRIIDTECRGWEKGGQWACLSLLPAGNSEVGFEV